MAFVGSDFPFRITVNINGTNRAMALDGIHTTDATDPTKKPYFPALKYQGASYSREAVDGSSTGRNQKGTMIREMVATKVKWQLEFVPCNQEQLKHLLDAVEGVTFQFTYPDPTKTSGASTGTFYVGSRSAPVWQVDRTSSSGALWGNLKMDFIEM